MNIANYCLVQSAGTSQPIASTAWEDTTADEQLAVPQAAVYRGVLDCLCFVHAFVAQGHTPHRSCSVKLVPAILCFCSCTGLGLKSGLQYLQLQGHQVFAKHGSVRMPVATMP